jgi:hypothetical protein
MLKMDPQTVTDQTRRWIETIVIGLNLCPFARRVFQGGLIRYVVSPASTEGELVEDLDRELQLLADTPVTQIETTLLIHPHVLDDFQEYNDFLAQADQLIAAMRLRGVIQIASFHPQYTFDGTRPDDVENATNRSPFPMLHLLREESVSRVSTSDIEEVPRRNVELLRKLGWEKLLELMERVTRGS